MNAFTRSVLVLVCSSSLLHAGQIINGDFESGDLSGWSVSASGGLYWQLGTPEPHPYEGDPFPEYPFSWTTNPNLVSAINHTAGVIPGRSPDGGAYVARVHSQDAPPDFSAFSEFTAPDGSLWRFSAYGVVVKLSQGVWLNAGSKVDGWAQFGTEDYWVGQDHVEILVGDQVVWEASPAGVDIAPPREGPWEHWEYVVPNNGFYEITIAARGDDQQPSWVTFDNIRVEAVPDSAEPMLAFGLALLGVVVVVAKRLNLTLTTG